MKKILVTRRLNDNAIDTLKEHYEVVVHDEDKVPMPRGEFLKEISDAHAVISMLSDNIDEEVFNKAKKLEVVANLAVGFDNIDLKSAKAHGVVITNTPDVLTETTAELGFTLMLTAARRIVEASNELLSGNWTGWSPYHMAGTDVYGKTIGIYGMGSIGVAFARRLKGFNCEVIYHNRSESEQAKEVNATYVSFDELLAQSDFLLCAAPLTNETKGIFDYHTFEKMKSSAYFVNIGRGQHVIEKDLIRALNDRQIRGAALDVFAKEPIDKSHPFLKLDNVTLLPHIGSASVDTRDTMIDLCVDNVINVLEGKPAKTPVEYKD